MATTVGRAGDGLRPERRRVIGRLLAYFTRAPTLGQPAAIAVIAAILLVIGLADYASGTHVSLSVFYVVPILLAVAWLDWRAAVMTVAAAMIIRVAGDLLVSPNYTLPLYGWWNAGSTLLVFLFIVWIFASLLGIHRQLEARVEERSAELLHSIDYRRLLEHELLTISSSERNRMGQELHDDICQHLVATTLAAKVLAQRLASGQGALAEDAQAIIALLEEGTGKTRQLARGLLLSTIEPSQLPDKLSGLAEEGSRSGVPCRFQQAGQVTVGDADTAAQLYRIAQEAMRNAVRHAEATRVDISLVGDEHAICLMVEDDGRGLPDTTGSGLGLPIMSHRAAYIGATLSLVPMTSRGTRMLCHLPLAAAPA